jgi:hypothetical protein
MIRAACVAAVLGGVAFVAAALWQSPLRTRSAPLSKVFQTASLDGAEQWRSATARLMADRARVSGEPGAMPAMLASAIEPLGQFMGVTLPAPSEGVRRAMRQPLSAIATSVNPASNMPAVVRAVSTPGANFEQLLSRVQSSVHARDVRPAFDDSFSIDSSGFVAPR